MINTPIRGHVRKRKIKHVKDFVMLVSVLNFSRGGTFIKNLSSGLGYFLN